MKVPDLPDFLPKEIIDAIKLDMQYPLNSNNNSISCFHSILKFFFKGFICKIIKYFIQNIKLSK